MTREVAQRQPYRDRRPPGGRAQCLDGQRADEQDPQGHRQGSSDDQRRAGLVGQGQAADAYHDQQPGQQGRAVGGPGPRRPGRQGQGDREAGDGAGWPPRRAGRRRDRQHHAQGDQVPGNGERVDPVTGERLQVRGGHEPQRQPEDGSGRGGDGTDYGPARDHHHPQLLACRPDRGEHAELALAAGGNSSEASGGDQGDQQQQDRDQRERDRRGFRLGAGTPRLPHQRAAERGAEGAEAGGAGVQQHRHRLRAACRRGRDKGELVVQVAGVLDDSGHGAVMSVEGQGGPDVQLEGLRYPAGDGDLPSAGGVAALRQGERRAAVGPVRVFCPVLDGLGRTRDRHEPAADHLNGPERLPCRRDIRLQGLRVGSSELQQVVGGAELRAGKGRHVVGGRLAEGSRRDGEGQQRQDQELLPPLAAQQPKRPPGHSPAGSHAAPGRPRQRRPAWRNGGHGRGPVVSSDPGPAGVRV